MRVQGQIQSLQFLQAQQAFRPNTQKNQPAFETPAPPVSKAPASSQALLSVQSRISMDEVKQIAQRAGYVGLEETDIQRAYLSGSSLLADYRA